MLITRAEPEASGFAEALAAHGHDALKAPLLSHQSLTPPDDLDARLEAAQAVLLTSVNGARALAEATSRRDLRLLVVGDATAAAAEALGFHDTLSAAGDVTALAVLVRKQVRADAGPLLHAGGTATAGDLVGQLTASGYAISHVALYETRLADTLPFDVEHALSEGTVDVVTLFSPRTAEAFVKLASRPEIARGLAKTDAVAMSPAVADRIATLPWRSVAVAGRPTQDEMLLAIDRLSPPPAAAADPGEPDMSDAPAKPTPAASDPPPPPEPAPKPAAKPEPTRQPRRGLGVIGAFITGIVATIVVLAAITVLYLANPEAMRDAAYALTGQTPPPSAADRLKPLQDRIVALEAKPAPSDPSPALRESIGRVEQRVEAQERRTAAIQELSSKLDALTQRVETMANRPPTAAGPSPDAARLESALGQLRSELAVLKSELQSAQTTLKALAARPADAPTTPGTATSADTGDAARQIAVLVERLDRLEKRDAQAAGTTANLAEKAEVVRQLAELEARLRAEIARGASTDSGARDAAAQARARADAIEKEIAARLDAVTRETATKIEGLNRDLAARAGGDERALTSSRGAAVIGVAARLRQALEAGGPFTSSLEMLTPLAALDPQVAAMREELVKVAPTGVVPVRVLAGEFPTVARAVIAADLADDSFWQRVLGKLKSIVSIRRVGESTKGMEADAILARAEAAVNAGDLGRAVGEVKQLKGAAATPAATWLISAETHLAAERVVDRLSLHGVSLLSRGAAK
ncbi:MAG: uroporphyrinogen-III synthase [Alphaproteobacteria bacterium]|nr:uroporphyrinogen-III synthase [Alphaproteobacteria bacterium]MCW5741384.1 uroporphyrinogen-III synthase [Alphaproteobacteria bacterium]